MNLNERINQKNNDLDAWNIHKKELAESCIKKIENNALRGKKIPFLRSNLFNRIR